VIVAEGAKDSFEDDTGGDEDTTDEEVNND